MSSCEKCWILNWVMLNCQLLQLKGSDGKINCLMSDNCLSVTVHCNCDNENERELKSVFILHLHEWHTRNHILSCGGFLEVEIIIDNIWMKVGPFTFINGLYLDIYMLGWFLKISMSSYEWNKCWKQVKTKRKCYFIRASCWYQINKNICQALHFFEHLLLWTFT